MIICGTGHRPDKLGGYGIAAHVRLIALAKDGLLSLRPRVSTVISGGALGWDQALAAAAMDLEIPYQMYLPFPEFWSKWPKDSQEYLELLCSTAAKIRYVSEAGYNPYKMQVRNEAMVDSSELVLALWNGTSGGTANCVKYAEKVGKPVVNLWDKYNV
jgi:uncharacterized phage-like protein YoqJ